MRSPASVATSAPAAIASVRAGRKLLPGITHAAAMPIVSLQGRMVSDVAVHAATKTATAAS